MVIKKWDLLDEKDISPSKWFPLFRHKIRLGNGKIVEDYFVSKLGNVSMVIPFTEDGRLILVRQYKHGVGEITIEFPAGRIESDQTPVSAAEAELKQETGVRAKSMDYIGELLPSPTKDSTRVHGFVARNCAFSEKQTFDDTEEIEIIETSETEFEQWIRDGKVKSSDCVALWSLFKLKLGDEAYR
ncbi:MAG: NUDIX hydrolase [Treponemataceae bacterium]